MRPYLSDGDVTLHLGDCVEVMAAMEPGWIDAIVCDPPYGLGFMGKEWDRPGQAARPTTTSVAKAESPFARKAAEYGGASYGTDSAATGRLFQAWCETWATQALRLLKPGGHLLAFGGTRTFHRLTCAIEDAGFEIRDCLSWLYGSGFPKSRNLDGEWQGWGTALKPAWEPIVVARKPLGGTVAANVIRHGTGALNVDGCRIEGGERPVMVRTSTIVAANAMSGQSTGATASGETTAAGRWPANVVLDEAAAERLDGEVGELTSGANPTRRGSDKFRTAYGDFEGQRECHAPRGQDTGGPSRFFYTAKASTAERDGATHPTVKPLALMRWLVRLVTPPGGVVLDCFAGSGTTIIAARDEGFRAIGIEREEEYARMVVKRYRRRFDPAAAEWADAKVAEAVGQLNLLGEAV